MTLIKCAYVAATVVAATQASVSGLILASVAGLGFVIRCRERRLG